MKKLLAIVLTLVMLLSIVPFGAVTALAEETVTSGTTGDCTWTLDGTVLTISGNGAMMNYDRYYDGCDWQDFDPPWKYKKITEVIIEEGVTSIGNNAFKDCKSLTNVTLLGDVTRIGWYAFKNCTRLTSITIPDSVTEIVSDAFYGCKNLKSVYITDVEAWCNINYRCTYMDEDSLPVAASPLNCGADLYLNGIKLTEVVIPDGVTSIDLLTFYNCKSITSITIPDSVTTIGDAAFYGCENLKSVYITDLAAWCNINYYSPYDDYPISSNPLNCGADLYLNGTKLTELVIPEGVTNICSFAFYNCKSLTSVIIGNSVTAIDEEVFYGCTNLVSVTIGNSVTSIESSTFKDCTSLKSITIPKSVFSIGLGAFDGCTNLTDVFYGGHVWDRAVITFRPNNDNLLKAEWHYYNCKHVYDNECDATCNICYAEREVKGQHLIEEDGATYYYVDGEKSNITSLVKINGKWHYIKGGKFASNETTLVKYNGKWYHVKNGLKTTSTTLVKYNGKWYYVEKGVKTTKTTLVKYNGVWYYVKDGKKNTSTTLVKYNGVWYYVKSGKKNTSTTLVKYNGTWYYVKSGKKNTSTAIVKYNGKKYYVKKGIAQLKFSGKVKISGKTYTVKKGVVK